MEILGVRRICFLTSPNLGGKMDVWNDILSIVISNGVFAVLFVWLFLYQLKDSSKREKKYQQTIEQLTTSLKVLDDVKHDLSDIKEFLKSGDDDEEFL